MKKLYDILKDENCTLSDVKKNMGQFVFLPDEEIRKIYEDYNITSQFKTLISETCFNRINKLPHELFIIAASYVTNPNILIEKYLNRINRMNYDEFVSLIYDSYLEPECLIKIYETDIMKKHLKNENEIKLKCFSLSAEIYLNQENLESLEMIGKRIYNFVLKQEEYTEEIESVIEQYFEKINAKIDELDIHSPLILNGILLMRDCIKKHTILSPAMLKFYISYRRKDLELEEQLENIKISSSDMKNHFGSYQRHSKTITIYYDQVIEIVNEAFKKEGINDKKVIADSINKEFLHGCSHELSHALDAKKSDAINEELFQKDETFYRFNLANEVLRLSMKYKEYMADHGKFINENRADLFSFIDFGMLINGIFKDCFSEKNLQLAAAIDARKIINLYTIQTEKGKKITPPIKKFRDFLYEKLPNLPTLQFEKSEDILKSLLLGAPIPKEVIIEINKIATGRLFTTNLYLEIINSIMNYQNNNQMHETPTQK